MKVFGQEPAALVGVVEAGLAVLLSFGLLDLDQNKVAAIVAVTTAVLGLVVAYATKDTMLGVLVGLSKSVLVLGVAYGLTLTDAQSGALMALVVIAAGFWNRGKTSPSPEPSFA